MDSLLEKWDKAAEKIDIDPLRPYRYGMALRYLNNIKNAKILEIGCGEGSGLSYFVELGYKNLTGVEISKERLKRANKKLLHTVILKKIGSDSILPFDDNSFDVVISLAVIEHVTDIKRYLKEIYRVTTKNAIIIISSDCYSWRILQKIKWYISDQPIDKTYTYNNFKKLFNSANMRIKHFDVFNLPERGAVLFYYFMRKSFLYIIVNILKKLLSSPKAKKKEEIKIVKEVLSKPIGITQEKKVKILNFFYDENIFLLEKINAK